MNKIISTILFIFMIAYTYSNDLLKPYYDNEELSDFAALENYYSSKNELCDNNNELNVVKYINSCKILSYYYGSGALKNNEELIFTLEDEIESLINFTTASSTVNLCYADFLYSELTWKKNNHIVMQKYPIICRSAIRKDGDNNEAKLKYALWCIFSVSNRTNNFNSYIKQCEKYIEILNIYDKYNAYLQYSEFYKKIYNTKKYYFYRNKAKELFPNKKVAD